MRARIRDRRVLVALVIVAVLSAFLAVPTTASAANPCGPPVTSVIACENTLAGDPASDWQVSGAGDSTIQGYATSMSVNLGETVTFKINSTAKSYHIDILRMGYYQGNGARKVAAGVKPTATLPQSQPACLTDATSGLIDCGNWAVSASWTVPSTAVSGVYLAHLVRDDTGGSSLIPFVVRNDSSTSDIVMQTSDETWQAYNTYGGNSLYQCTVACPPGNPGGYKAAYKVSYNRPFHSAADDSGASWIMYAEYPMIRFLEENGYDVSYMSGLDVASRGSLLTNHKTFLSVGHDEYWSGDQRANVEAARDHGVNLAFFSGNEVFWKTRWEPSGDGTNTPNRTLVTYKETHFDAPVDPKDPPTWTGTWADPRFTPPADSRPQNSLTGQLFIVNSGTTDIKVPAQYGSLRLWRNTPVAKLSSGQSVTLGAGLGTLGYEWDEDADDGFRPAGTFDLSSTTSSTAETFIDYGTNVLSNQTATHHLTMYRAASGALVFGAGTVQWTWGLDGATTGKSPDPTMQQATVNLLADMGAQPYGLISGLVAATASADSTAPTSAITSPVPGTNVADGTQLTITGTASDTGGVVAGVEVSTDGGTSWHPATGTTSWSYSWVAHGSPSSKILSRAVDDSGNLETPGSGTTVNVSCVCTMWGPNVTPPVADSGDGNAVEIGEKFTTDTFGTVSGIRFYKSSSNTGTHIGNLWSASGQLLARATFSGESASGWQQVNFSQPVPIMPNTTYVASYYAPAGHYAQSEGYMFGHPAPQPDGNDSLDSAPLHLLRNSSGTTNGLYGYSSSTAFPTSTYNGENYWVDVSFSPSPPPGQVTNVVASPGYGSAGVTWSAPTTGGSVTTYTVTPIANGVAQTPTTVTGSPAPTNAIVAGLANGTSYTFTVTAANPNGSGPASSPSSAVTPSSSASLTQNGGFESGLTYWTPGGVYPPAPSTAKAHSGTGSAVLGTLSGAEPSGDSSLSQNLSLPAGSKATLSFWYWPATTDALCSGTCQWDWQEAQIRSTSGTVLASVFKGNSNAQAWTQVTYDLSAYAGQTVVLWFNVHGDGANPPDDTSMYLDDVAVTLSGSSITAPGAPTNVSAQAGNASATVSWTPPASNGGSAITGYTVTPFVGTTAKPATTVSGSATSAAVSGLSNGTTYTFTVAATNAAGTGPASTASNPVTPATVPTAPTNVTATAGNGSATVSWTAPASNGGSAITGYTVTPYTGSTAGSPTTVAASATTAVVSGLTNGTAYTFTVTATNAVGPGPASTASNAVTPAAPTPPGAPTNVTATAGDSSATVSWTVPASDGGSPITGYTITPYTGSTPGSATTVAASVTTAVVSGLTDGTTYTFTVAASNAVGPGPASAASNPVTPVALPGAPTNVTATAGNASATVSWTAPASDGGSPITSYTITPYTGSTPGSTTTVAASVTTAVVSGLTNGTTYTFTVAATTASGTGPASTASNPVTPATVPGAPTNVTAAAGNASATVSWTAPASNGGSAITGYTITPYTGSTAGSTTTVSASVTTAVVSGLTNGTAYTFTVAASNAAGPGPASAASNSVTPVALPGPPTNVTATAGNASATVSWTAPSDGNPVTGYTVTPYVGTTAQSPLTVSASVTTAVVNGLTNGTTYTFTVAASNSAGTGPASAASNPVTPATVPGAPTNVTATVGNASATVSWTAPASNGGSAITAYTVTPYIGSAAQSPTTVSAPATSTVVGGLTNGTAYTFTVSAANVIGPGAQSTPSNAVTPASVYFVQQTAVHGKSKTSLTATLPAAVVAGNRLVVEVGVWSSRNATASTVTDSAGNVYTELLHFVASEGTEESVWSAPITAGGGTIPTITVRPTSSADVGIAVLEYAGLSAQAGTAVVDQVASKTGKTGTAGTVSSGATPATTSDGELALGFYADSGFNDTLTAGAGFTARSNISKVNDMELLVEDQPVGLGATPNAAAGTGASTVWLMATIVFKHA